MWAGRGIAMSADFIVKKNSNARSLFATLTSTNSADDLSTATSTKLYMRIVGATTNKINGITCAVTTAATSAISVRYDWAAGDLDTPGLYEAYFLVTYTGGKVDRFPAEGYNTILVEPNFEA